MRISLLSFILVFLSQSINAQNLSEFYSKSDKLFSNYVKNGMVDYSAIASNKSDIKDLYITIAKANLVNASPDEKKAFYINAYNVIVIYQIVKYYAYHQKSPMDQGGFFDQIKHVVAGAPMTLNALEIKYLLRPYEDARIHFVLACAAKSCPSLANWAYMPDKLEKQLESRTKLALNDGDWLKIKGADQKVLLSKIFSWYETDFTREGTVLEFINKYRKSPIPDTYQIDYYEYDWNLNEG